MTKKPADNGNAPSWDKIKLPHPSWGDDMDMASGYDQPKTPIEPDGSAPHAGDVVEAEPPKP